MTISPQTYLLSSSSPLHSHHPKLVNALGLKREYGTNGMNGKDWKGYVFQFPSVFSVHSVCSVLSSSSLSQKLINHQTLDVGQTEITPLETIGQLLVIEPE